MVCRVAPVAAFKPLGCAVVLGEFLALLGDSPGELGSTTCHVLCILDLFSGNDSFVAIVKRLRFGARAAQFVVPDIVCPLAMIRAIFCIMFMEDLTT